MVVYGEYLFLENFITGGIILYFTAKVAGEPLKILRGILCSLCCGAYAFTMFITVSPLLGFLGKMGFVLLISLLASVGGAFFHSDNPLRRGSYCLSWYVFLGRGGFHRRRIYAGCNLYDDNGGSILWGAFH